jgi:hypothetical protein
VFASAFPLASVSYLAFFVDPHLLFVSLFAHQVISALVVLLSLGVAYVTYLAYRRTRYSFLLIHVFGFIGFALFELIHGISAWYSNTTETFFVLSSAISKAFLSVYLFWDLTHVREHSLVYRRERIGIHIFFFILLLSGSFVVSIIYPGLIPPLSLALLGFSVFTFSLLVGAVFLEFESSFPKWAYICALYLFGLASVSSLLGSPWNHLWWLSHFFVVVALILMGYLAATVYETHKLLESTFKQNPNHNSQLDLRATLFAFCFALLLFGATAYSFSPLYTAWSHRYLQTTSNRVFTALTERARVLGSAASEALRSPSLQRLILSRDIPGIVDALNSLQRTYGFSGALALDSSGTALTRTHLLSKTGDRRFEATATGRILARDLSVQGFDAGSVFPFIINAGSVFSLSDGKLGGALLIGQALDSAYAARTAIDSLPRGAHIAFYTLAGGIVGDDFDAILTSRLLASYFSPGSGLLPATTTLFLNRPLDIQGTSYRVIGTPLVSPEGDPIGGFIVFTPDTGGRWIVLVAGIIGFLFLILFLLFFRIVARGIHLFSHIHILIIIGGIALSLFVGIVFTLDTRYARQTLSLRQAPYAIYNSTLQFNPETSLLSLGVPYAIALNVLPGGESINALQATIHYDPTRIAIADISTTDSLCDPQLLFEREIDAKQGSVHLSCAIPYPGFQGRTGVFAQLMVTPLVSGPFALHIDSAEVLAADGLGTNVLRSSWDGSYIAADPTVARALPYSPTHPNAERWYNNRNIRFFWREIPDTSFAAALTQSTTTPELTSMPDGAFTTSVANDGIWYFHFQEKTASSSWMTIQPIRVDTAPPLISLAASDNILSPGSVLRITIHGEDSLSGLQNTYYVSLDHGVFLPAGPQLYLSLWEKGLHTITARVFDRADNITESSLSVTVR